MDLIRLSEDTKKKYRKKFKHKKKYNIMQYEKLIEPIIKTHTNITYDEFANKKKFDNEKLFLLRHDIDHDFETAMLMARWEHKHGLRATYCVLHSAWYYGILQNGEYFHTEDLVWLCRELAGLGHEINFHNNLMTLSLQEKIDVNAVLSGELNFLRSLGLKITGTSSHGDRLCRALNYRNYEIFKEAVGIEFGGQRIVYSSQNNHSARVGVSSMESHGLLYEAYDIAMDAYISDAGGAITTSTEIKQRHNFLKNGQEKAGNVIGILTHPVWWDFD
ncbi:hypothetical protein OOT00_15295 [Desulfobotulus sp. H1]|uniref:Uncharacterized protein n=1 Tax=Desulfobotulus pelophilus TaxID=2823377 RepID=A0ABT3ND04_9BACT|nr:hypothetical protein [Desulfobotulus pelophilus]MCW7755348.1 hypothetical protein [Desulfobotulus pelophilus]